MFLQPNKTLLSQRSEQNNPKTHTEFQDFVELLNAYFYAIHTNPYLYNHLLR